MWYRRYCIYDAEQRAHKTRHTTPDHTARRIYEIRHSAERSGAGPTMTVD